MTDIVLLGRLFMGLYLRRGQRLHLGNGLVVVGLKWARLLRPKLLRLAETFPGISWLDLRLFAISSFSNPIKHWGS